MRVDSPSHGRDYPHGADSIFVWDDPAAREANRFFVAQKDAVTFVLEGESTAANPFEASEHFLESKSLCLAHDR